MLIDAALKLRGQFVKLTTIKCTIGDLLCTFPEQFSHIILCYASNIKEIILFYTTNTEVDGLQVSKYMHEFSINIHN